MPTYPIAFIERSTGISRETLRMWERRYGYPAPARDEAGDRQYTQADLERLRRIKRLLDQGYRPGRIVPLAASDLADMETRPGARAAENVAEDDAQTERFLALLREAGGSAARNWLRRRMARQTLAEFVTGTIAPLTLAVGDAWAAGRLNVHEEHLYTELAGRLLRRAIEELPTGAGPLILLATLPEERHGLGLLMAEALLSAQGARCLSLGVDIPIPEIVLAANQHGAGAVALSFSAAYPRRRILPQIEALRAQLPPTCRIWAGGRVTARLRAGAWVRFCPELAQAPALLAELKVALADSTKPAEPVGEMG